MFAAQGPGSVFADPLPGVPMNVTVEPASGNAGRTTLVLTWDAVADATGYRVDRSADGAVWETIPDATKDHPVSQTSYEDDDDLVGGQTRNYRVFAVNDHGTGPASASASGTTKARGLPGPVKSLMATGSDYNEITLSWEEPDDTGGDKITGYEIQRHVPGVGNTWAHVAIEEDETSYAHTVHISPDDWIYRVRALNQTPVAVVVDAQNSTSNDAHAGEWTRVTGNSKSPSNPSPVTGLTAVNTASGSISLYWYAPTNNGGVSISHYIVQARLTGNGENVDWADLPDVDAATELAALSTTATLDATADDPSFTIRIAAPDAASVSQQDFTGVTVQYDHDGDTAEATPTPEVTASWQFQVYTETTEPGVDGAVGTGNDDGAVRRSAASGTSTSTAEARPDPDPLAGPGSACIRFGSRD